MNSIRLAFRSHLAVSAAIGLCLTAGVLAGGIGQAAPAGSAQAAADPVRFLADASSEADAALRRTDLADYRGWFKYLRLDAQTEAERAGASSAAAVAEGRRRDGGGWGLPGDAPPPG